MRFPHFVFLSALIASPAMAHETELCDPSIIRDARDEVVKHYRAGGPHTAFRTVADAWQKQTGHPIEIIAGPEKTWAWKAKADADLIWGTSEQSLTAFLHNYKSFSSGQVDPTYIRPAIKNDNPKYIVDFDDRLKDDVKIFVTESAGMSNTSWSDAWEDIAGHSRNIEDVRAFRTNIFAFASGSDTSFKAFKDMDADAWITWPNWPATNPPALEAEELSNSRKIWRDVNLALAPDADPEAMAFRTTWSPMELRYSCVGKAGFVEERIAESMSVSS